MLFLFKICYTILNIVYIAHCLFADLLGIFSSTIQIRSQGTFLLSTSFITVLFISKNVLILDSTKRLSVCQDYIAWIHFQEKRFTAVFKPTVCKPGLGCSEGGKECIMTLIFMEILYFFMLCFVCVRAQACVASLTWKWSALF